MEIPGGDSGDAALSYDDEEEYGKTTSIGPSPERSPFPCAAAMPIAPVEEDREEKEPTDGLDGGLTALAFDDGFLDDYGCEIDELDGL